MPSRKPCAIRIIAANRSASWSIPATSSGGVKKWEWIKKGVPIRIEIGPRDIETRKVCVQRRDQPVATKDFPVKEDFIRSAAEILDEIHHNLLDRSTAFRNANIIPCDSLEAFHAHWATENPGWLYTPWAGTAKQEDELSKQHKITIRCIPSARSGAGVIDGLPRIRGPHHGRAPRSSIRVESDLGGADESPVCGLAEHRAGFAAH
jgi:prolyl-tRNA synthetase